MSEISPRQFLELLKKSELVERTALKKSLADLNQEAGGAPVKLKRLADHLIDRKLITDWHREKLMNGKYRGFFLGQYRLLRLLGTGGMSTVYVAEHKLSRHCRAIKVLPRERVDDKSYLDRFYREGRAAAALNHPNIVRIYDLANEEDNHYMVMEFVEGIDLQELVKRDGPLPVNQVLEFARQAATGLKHAHDRGIVHRDVKPSNLITTQNGDLKVLDLGLALMNEGADSLTILHNDRVMGTADYLSPEQAINSHEVDHRADIYSLGCTLFFLLTGRPPFPDGSIAQRIAMHQSQEPPLVSAFRPDCPATVTQLVHLMIRKSREDRIQSCRELIAEIRAIQAELGGGVSSLSAIGDSLNMDFESSASAVAKESTGQLETASGSSRAATSVADPVAKSDQSRGLKQNGTAAPARKDSTRPPPPSGDNRPLRRKIVVPEIAGRASANASPIAAGAVPPAIASSQKTLSQRRRSNQKSLWIVVGIILGMFAVLLAVLMLALSLVQ